MTKDVVAIVAGIFAIIHLVIFGFTDDPVNGIWAAIFLIDYGILRLEDK